MIHNPKKQTAKKHLLLSRGTVTFLEELHVLKIMANVGAIVIIDSDASRPINSIGIIAGPYTIYIHDVIDDKIEKLRIGEELKKVDKQIAKLERKRINMENADSKL